MSIITSEGQASLSVRLNDDLAAVFAIGDVLRIIKKDGADEYIRVTGYTEDPYEVLVEPAEAPEA